MGNKQKRMKRGLKKYYKQKGIRLSSRSSLATTTDENFAKTENAPEVYQSKNIKKSLPICSESVSTTRQVEDDMIVLDVNEQDDLGNQKLRSLPDDTFTHKHVVSSVEDLEDYSAACEVNTADFSEKAYKLEGRRILNLKTFYSKLQEVSSHGPFNCGLSSVEIVAEKQTGYQSTFTLQCKLCNMKFFISSDEGSEMNINNCAVLGTVAIGCGHSQLQELSASLDLPTISFKMYQKCHENISNMWEKISLQTMNDAAKEERELAQLQGRINENGVPSIDVIVDGCWSKRTYRKNYSALSGAAVIIGKETGKILFIGIKNKYCCICAQAEYKKVMPREHKCFKNYTGPSTGMESSILVEGFKCSIDMHGLIYGRMISDGDSATYSKIIETRPYSNTTVQKIECKNHIMRNLCNKLSQLKTETKYPLRYRKNITDQKIKAIRFSIKKAIEKHTSDLESEKRAHVDLLYNDILQVHVHAFGDHSSCKKYFCNKPNTENTNDNEFRTSTLWSKICQIMSNVASHAPSLIHNVESNKAVSYNSIIAKLVGGKRINYSLKGGYENRCKGAAISYNTRALLSTTYKYSTGKSPKGKVKLHEQRKLLKKKYYKTKVVRKRNRLLFSKGEDVHYGENCAREDMVPEMMEKEKITFVNNLKKSKEEREKIEKETILQSLCSEWLELRRKLLTASNFGRIIKRRSNISCSNLVKDLLYKDSISHVKSIKHGTENEKIALEQISKDTGIVIQPCGLFIDDELPYLGATPDGICVEENMVVEIKCPVAAHQLSFTEALTNKKIPFYKTDKTGTIIINTNHNWYYQIQGQLHITKKTRCLFGLWLGENIPMKIDIIEKDDKFWKDVMVNKLTRFYFDCVLPELIDPRYPRKMQIRDPISIQKAVKESANQNKLGKKRKQNYSNQNKKENELQEDNAQEKEENDNEKEIELGNEKEIEKKTEENENEEGQKKENMEQDLVWLSKFPKINICEHGEISEDEEVQPAKRIKILGERKLNFSEF